MILCHCRRVSDRTIREAVRDGALSRAQIARDCGAGSRCGGCRPAIDEILAEEAPARPGAPPAPPPVSLPVLRSDA